MKHVILAATAALWASSTFALGADYRKEAEQIAQEIVTLHPRGAEIGIDERFIRARAQLLEMAGNTDLPHYALALGKLFAAADDGHTAGIPAYGEDPLFVRRYPMELRRFHDGVYVVGAKGAASPLLGGRVIRVNGEDVNEILRSLVASSAQGNRAWPASFVARLLSSPGWMAGLDVGGANVADAATFDVTLPSGEMRGASFSASEDREGLSKLERPKTFIEAAAHGRMNFAARKGRVLVLYLGGMEDQEGRTFEQFTAEAASALSDLKLTRVIVDLRDNGGGNNMLAEPLRRTLIKSRFNKPGGLYVLTSPSTFSAAMNFTTRLERETDAIFVGEPTGGAPNHFGDAKFAHGPQSGIPYIISTLRWQDSTPFDHRRWIAPDLPAPPLFSDWIKGRDAALEAALAHDPGTLPKTDWRGRVVSPWERESQTASWRFFFEAQDAPAAD
jgi:hypothetical protein